MYIIKVVIKVYIELIQHACNIKNGSEIEICFIAFHGRFTYKAATVGAKLMNII